MTTTLDDAVDNPMLSSWCDKLSSAVRPPRVVLAEGDDPRVRLAATELVRRGIVPVLVREIEYDVRPSDDHYSLEPGVESLTRTDLVKGPAGHLIADVARRRGWAGETVAQRLHNPIYLAAACVELGIADACVAGSLHPTGDVLRAGIHVIGLAEDSKLLSSSFLLRMPDGSTLAFGDCAVVPEPDEHQLAEIAVATAHSFQRLTGRAPVVAMLSFSTFGSADHETVRRVRNATELVREMAPGLEVDGEMQFDTALIPSVAAQKGAGSLVAGRANVFIFPNLAAGNIGYKIAQRLGGAQAFGPIIQGLRAPMNDLSRGCSVSDIVNVAAISALQAHTSTQEGEPGSA